jgi:sigma-B regulation protein RsbU (phosphoserine phosphatase)
VGTLQDYLSDETLARLQAAFSAVADRPVRICDEFGQPLVSIPRDPRVWQKSLDLKGCCDELMNRRARPSRPESVDGGVAIALDEGIVGQVRVFADAARGEIPGKPPSLADYQKNLLLLMAAVVARLCNGAIELRSRIEQLMALHRVTAEITGARELDEVLDIVTRTVVEAMKAKASTIRLLSRDRQELLIRAGYNLSAEYLNKGPIRVSQSQIDQEVLTSLRPIAVDDLRTDPRVLYRDDSRREGLVSGLCAPMVYKDKPVGVLRVYTGEATTFDWFEQQLLQTIANAAAAAIVNARLYQEAVRSAQMKRELTLAGEVQRRMIPKETPRIEGFDLHAAYVPSQQLSGDFFDFIDLEPENLGIAICDVAGKGVRASLLMASIRGSLRAHATNVYEMSEVLEHVNRDLCADTLSSDFATMFYAVLHTQTRELTYSCAGHMPPILIRSGTVCHLETSGGVLGILPEMQYPVAKFTMNPGDMVLAYTDGLSEALNFEHEPYGRQRIEKAMLYAATQEYSAAGTVRHMLWDLRRFCGLHSRQDDLTMVVVKAV